MNIELSGFEKTVFKHAAKESGDFSKVYFIYERLKAERTFELTGLSRNAILRGLDLERGNTTQKIKSKYSIKDKARIFCETYFQKKETEMQTTSAPPARIKCRG